MNTYITKKRSLEKLPQSNHLTQRKSKTAPVFQLQDNRLTTVQHHKIQALANASSQVSQLQRTQQLANQHILQKKPNNTGLPNQLKSGIENLSGYSMDDVKVHYNSSKPAHLQAHAFAQGTDIHLAAGQEKHLAHEAWHVVQQKQGRVQPTMQLKGKVNINDDEGLEREADIMGSKALQTKKKNQEGLTNVGNHTSETIQKTSREPSTVQLVKEEVGKAIYKTIKRSYKADDGIAYLYMNGRLVTSSIVPRPKAEIADTFGSKTTEKTVKDGENYLIHGMMATIKSQANAMMAFVDANAELVDKEVKGWGGKTSTVKQKVKTPQLFKVEVEIVGSAGACDHCKERLAAFKVWAQKYINDLIAKGYARTGSSTAVNYHYTTREKQTGPGPGGNYGWDDATEERGEIGRHAHDATEYTWWKKTVA